MEGDQRDRAGEEPTRHGDRLEMDTGGRIFIGDLVRALLKAGSSDGADWPAVAAMLGIRFDPRSTSKVEQKGSDTGTIQQKPDLLVKVPPPQAVNQDTPADIGDLIEFEIQRSTAPAESIPPAAVPADQRIPAKPLPIVPLFQITWERGILLEAAGTSQREGELVVIEAVQWIARGESWRDLPFERIQSFSKGCQILVDTGIGMQPFAADTRQLVLSIRRAAGAQHVRLLTFVDCPAPDILTETYVDQPYRPPDNGATVLAISDLGCGGPRSAIRGARPEDWLGVARTVRDAGSSLIVINPYPPNRWPASLINRIPIVHWHRTTRSADVRKTRRRFRG